MMVSMRRILRDPKTQLDDRLRQEVGGDIVETYSVSTKALPGYRFVDLYRALEAILATKTAVRHVDAQSPEDLSSLLQGERGWASRQIAKAVRTAWPIGADEELFLPIDRFHVFAAGSHEANGRVIVRLTYDALTEAATLAAAGLVPEFVEALMSDIIERSLKTSIYRGRMLALAYEAGTKDEYGDVEKAEQLRINLKVASPVPADEFVVDDDILQTIQRNVIDLHQRRDLLKAKGVPIRRGVLMYGPPGTGKTFATRYICGALPETTRIIVTGTALHRVNQVFDFARTYQPAVVILEDVDLVFAARDINLYSSALGDLLDQMDGLRPFEDITIVLTTNSIERMEAAIKDRPGRISQVIHFGAPVAGLRRRYIEHYLLAYDAADIDIDALVERSDGTTPAFIKEWVHRAVQMATERLDAPEDELDMTTADFEAAFMEMRRFSEGSTGRIVGFLGPAER